MEPATHPLTNTVELRSETSQASVPILPNANPASLGPLLPSQSMEVTWITILFCFC